MPTAKTVSPLAASSCGSVLVAYRSVAFEPRAWAPMLGASLAIAPATGAGTGAASSRPPRLQTARRLPQEPRRPVDQLPRRCHCPPMSVRRAPGRRPRRYRREGRYARDEQPDQPERRQTDRERSRETVARRSHEAEHATPAAGPQTGGIRRCQCEVTRSRRRRGVREGGPQEHQIGEDVRSRPCEPRLLACSDRRPPRSAGRAVERRPARSRSCVACAEVVAGTRSFITVQTPAGDGWFRTRRVVWTSVGTALDRGARRRTTRSVPPDASMLADSTRSCESLASAIDVTAISRSTCWVGETAGSPAIPTCPPAGAWTSVSVVPPVVVPRLRTAA